MEAGYRRDLDHWGRDQSADAGRYLGQLLRQ